MAPELLSGRTASTPKIDVWSMGCMLYAMLSGEYAFSAKDREKLRDEICQKQLNITGAGSKFLASQCFSDECLDLLNRMLIKEPNDRISIHEILQHPWIMKHVTSKKLVFDWTKDSSDEEETKESTKQKSKRSLT